jgi:hypothetical protein
LPLLVEVLEVMVTIPVMERLKLVVQVVVVVE